MVAGLTTGLKVSSQSMPTCLPAPSPISRALCLSKEPPDFSLCLKIQIDIITLTSGGRGTKSYVSFLIKALYSSCMAIFQLGSLSTDTEFLGKGDFMT